MRSQKPRSQKSMDKARQAALVSIELPKCPTGIHGLDEITLGGLPRGRTTLVCGGPGCGKTLLGMEFLVRGVTQFDEPGVCVSFEETAEELVSNVSSLGFDIGALVARKKLLIDQIAIERSLIEESGPFDLEALFIRIGHSVDAIGAKRVLFDSVEILFAGLHNEAILRAELRRLFQWLKSRKLTTIVTGERGAGALTRHGLEEYISDCVILLDHRVAEGVVTRRLRVVKYRGSTHGTNEYPFLIEASGISVLPVTSAELKHVASSERVSTGVPELDVMLAGKGYHRASSILVSGTAGTGKSSIASHYINAACSRGEKCIFFSFEESTSQLVRNMRSIGIDLEPWVGKDLLHFKSVRPTKFGLEMHLVKMFQFITEIGPRIVVVDPITAVQHLGTESETANMVLRLVDFLKERQITALLTTLTTDPDTQGQMEANISSLMDTWIVVRDIESGGERNRGLYILKARGIAHSNQIREFALTGHGIKLREAYLGEVGLLTGSARVMQEAKDASNAVLAQQEIEKKQVLLERKRAVLNAQIAALHLDLETEERDSHQLIAQEKMKLFKLEHDRGEMARSRFVAAIAKSDVSGRVVKGTRR